MRFKSLDELVEYMFTNKVTIGDIEMNVEGESGDPAVTPDIVSEPVEEPEVDPQGKVEESITLRLASGDIQLQLHPDGSLLVDDFQMTPNSCGAGSIVIEGRKIHLNMCEMEGKTMAYLHTNNGQNDAIAVRRKS